MVRVSQEFSGNYLKAADLPTPRVLTIQSVTKETVGESEQKIVARFAGEQQGLVLNKTNALFIAGLYGDEMDNWPGKQVELYSTQTNFGGKMVPCVRVRQPQAAPPQQPAVPQQPLVQAPDFPIDA